jgi:CRP-like cAMP-binding protein
MCIAGGAIKDLTNWTGNKPSRIPANMPIRHLRPHENLFFEGDDRNCLYIVDSGWVKLYRTLVDGQRQIVGFANAGSILGLESDVEHANSCEAITAVTVRSIPVARIAEICLTDAGFANQLLRQVGRQLGAAQAQLAAVGTQSAEQKLANFLLTMADLCETTETGEFDLPTRRGDMAEFLGLRLETVSRKMTEFQRRGLIEMTSLYHCRIVRRHLLEELAEGGEIDSDADTRPHAHRGFKMAMVA